MKFAIIITKPDIASLNIKENLLKLFPFKKAKDFEKEATYELKDAIMYTVNERCVYCEDLDKKIKADFFIFATPHKSESGKPTLTVHPIGNWGKAELGGKENTLCPTSSKLIKLAFLNLNKFNTNPDYEVSMEQTHHGPHMSTPTIFVEIGSSEKQWQDYSAGGIIARTIMETIEQFPKAKFETTILLGGGHYNQAANKVLLNTDVAISHICSKYYTPILDEKLLTQAIKKTYEKVDFITLDWKGLGQEKQNIISLLEKMKLKYKKYQELTH